MHQEFCGTPLPTLTPGTPLLTLQGPSMPSWWYPMWEAEGRGERHDFSSPELASPFGAEALTLTLTHPTCTSRGGTSGFH